MPPSTLPVCASVAPKSMPPWILLPEITGAVVVGWMPSEQSDEVIVLCVVLAQGQYLDATLEQKIRRTIRDQTSPRHVPHHLVPISEVPVTRSGKPVELSVKAILAGREISNREALANPQVLEEFQAIREQLLRYHTSESPAARRTSSHPNCRTGG